MDKTKQLETALVIVLGLVVIYWFKRHNALLAAAIVVGVSALLVPAAAQGIHWCWMQLSRIMGAVSGRVLLTLVYVLVLLPMAMVARWSGKGNLRMKGGGPDYFKSRNHLYVKEDLEHPW